MKKQDDKAQAGAWFTDAVDLLYGRVMDLVDEVVAGELRGVPKGMVRAVAVAALVKALASMNLSLRMLENGEGETARGLRPPKFDEDQFFSLGRMTAPVALAEEKPAAKAPLKRGRRKNPGVQGRTTGLVGAETGPEPKAVHSSPESDDLPSSLTTRNQANPTGG